MGKILSMLSNNAGRGQKPTGEYKMSNLRNEVEAHILLEKIKAFAEIIQNLEETNINHNHVTELLALTFSINKKITSKS